MWENDKHGVTTLNNTETVQCLIECLCHQDTGNAALYLQPIGTDDIELLLVKYSFREVVQLTCVVPVANSETLLPKITKLLCEQESCDIALHRINEGGLAKDMFALTVNIRTVCDHVVSLLLQLLSAGYAFPAEQQFAWQLDAA